MAAEGEGGGPEADSDLGDLCPEARPYLHLRDRVPESGWSGRPSQDGREGEREGRPGGRGTEGQRDRGRPSQGILGTNDESYAEVIKNRMKKCDEIVHISS